MKHAAPDPSGLGGPDTGNEGWNHHGYWVGKLAEPSIAEQHAVGVRISRARCGGPGMCRDCGVVAVHRWYPPGRHARPDGQ